MALKEPWQMAGSRLVKYNGKDCYVVVPDYVTCIGSSAFYRRKVTGVLIPDHVTEIRDTPFYGCEDLVSVSIGFGVEKIGKNPFWNCCSLESITVSPYSARYSSVDGVLYNKDKTALLAVPPGRSGKFVVPDGVRKIGGNAFNSCERLTEIVLPEGLEAIGNSAFQCCSALRDVKMPDGLKEIGFHAFAWCSQLSVLTIPDSVIALSAAAFHFCGVNTVHLPTGISEINRDLFSNCKNLQSLRIPDGVTAIHRGAFDSCNGMKEITVPSTVKNLGQGAFDHCMALKTVIFTGTEEQWKHLRDGYRYKAYPKGLYNAGAVHTFELPIEDGLDVASVRYTE